MKPRPRARSSKYRNIRTVVDGIRFDSLKESRRYGELKLLQRAGEISDLECHVRFPLHVKDQHICDYVCDFRYTPVSQSDSVGYKAVVEDVKSPATRTAAYKIKAKLMKAIYNITVRET